MEFIVERERIYKMDDQGHLLAEITFPEVREGVFNIDHTFVDESLRGQGVAGQLMEAAVSQIHSFLLFHLLYNTLWDIGTDILLEGQQLADSRRAQGLVLGLGTEIDGLKLWSQLVIEVVHIAFIEEVLAIAQPANQARYPIPSSHFYCQLYL